MSQTVRARVALAGTTLVALLALYPAGAARAIPAFARKYRTSCSTCHTAPPKLNVLGEAFRLNGYRFPDNDALLRRDQPIPLGEDPWRDLWPRAIWPGELPGLAALALRIQTDIAARVTADSVTADFRFPHELYILGGASLGDHIGAFVEAEWSRADGLEVAQATLHLQHIVPWVPERALNLWVGRQDLFLFTFADRQIDRAGRQAFQWQEFRYADVQARRADGTPLVAGNAFQLEEPEPAIELNGLAGSRLYYAVGVAQGAGESSEDNNRAKDVYYKVRYKLGGMGLDGTYARGDGPVTGSGGQLLDRTLILEHFGYFGSEPAGPGLGDDRHRTFGVAARALLGPVDLGGGYVWGSDDDPWGVGGAGLRHRSVFAKAEWLAWPWLIASLKVDRFALDLPAGTSAPPAEDLVRTRVIPGMVALIRQNVRCVVEFDRLMRAPTSASPLGPAPSLAYLRLDVAF
jgi:hypothetical protein